MKQSRTVAWIATITGVFFLLIPSLIPICTGRIKAGNELMPMVCHYAYQAEFIIGLLAVIVAASLFVLRTGEGRLFASFLIFLLGIAVIIIPQSWAVGICPAGACQKTTFFLNIAAVLYSLTGAVNIWLIYKKRQEEE